MFSVGQHGEVQMRLKLASIALLSAAAVLLLVKDEERERLRSP
jgi:hypothetical protein